MQPATLPPPQADAVEALRLIQRFATAHVADDRLGRDLTMRQIALLLRVHLDPGPHDFGNTAAALRLSTPAVSRAVDVLAAQDMIRREENRDDRRKVWLRPTESGAAFIRSLRVQAEGAR